MDMEQLIERLLADREEMLARMEANVDANNKQIMAKINAETEDI
jgi:hypothetical protein